MHVMVRYSDLSPVPWVNGRGQTTELISWDRSRVLATAPGPAWRLSVARLDGPAAFSPIPQVRRIFVPVGTSVTLTVNGISRRVTDHSPTEFAGDDDVDLVGLDRAPGHAVNLMVAGEPAGSPPFLTIGSTDDDLFRTCLLAVALEGAGAIDRFAVVTPDRAANHHGHQQLVAMIHQGAAGCLPAR